MAPGRSTRLLSLLLFLAVWERGAVSQSGTQRLPLTTQQVALALTNAAFPVSAANLQLPVPVLASVPAPRLRIDMQQQTGPHQHRLRVTCVDSGVCLPFYATVTGVAPEPLTANSTDSLKAAPAQHPMFGVNVLHAGDRALFLLESTSMRISLPVVLIDTGHPGADVRVASLDRKQVYQGKVWDDGTVHGSLP